MKKRRYDNDEDRNDVDNIIPSEGKPPNDAVITEYGRALLKLEPLSDTDFCRLLTLIEFIRQQDNYQSYLEMPKELAGKKVKIRTKKRYFITDEKIALALGMSRSGFIKRKRKIVRWLHNLSKHLNVYQSPH